MYLGLNKIDEKLSFLKSDTDCHKEVVIYVRCY